MKKYILLLVISVSLFFKGFAEEGMWLPQLLQTLNEKEMKRMGMKISAADIYSISKGSLKDAIVSFGGFCTAELISEQGLLLTNHHCGFDAIQNHSSIQNNYIRDGFWAYNRGQELQNPGLFATFIIRIDDVTAAVLNGITGNLTEKERQSLVDKNIAAFRTTVKKETYQDILIRPFFDANKYFLFVTETYRDIRLVGAPPSSIGNFGKDTDNWMWPRHTGDFSMFRIYADKNNKPAPYSAENVPYKPKRSLQISLDGVKEGDFTMVFGFPGATKEYLHSSAIEQIVRVSDPAKIAIRTKALTVIDGFMRTDEGIKIQYAAKYANISNAWKKWQGEVLGLTKTNAVAKRQELESNFEKIVLSRPEYNVAYVDLLKKLKEANTDIEPYGYARDYYNEIIPKVELWGIAADMNSLVTAYAKDEASYTKRKAEVLTKLEETFKEYNATVDQKLFEALMEMYVNDQKEEYVSDAFKSMLKKKRNSFSSLANSIYTQSAFTSFDKIKKVLAGSATDVVIAIKTDVAAKLQADILSTYTTNVSPSLNAIQANINQLQRTYMQAQMDVFTRKTFYPDANSTLRVTYGNVKPYEPR
ncbi:MAG: S46 family peptidase, partial [Ferruginibacter sp.]